MLLKQVNFPLKAVDIVITVKGIETDNPYSLSHRGQTTWSTCLKIRLKTVAMIWAAQATTTLTKMRMGTSAWISSTDDRRQLKRIRRKQKHSRYRLSQVKTNWGAAPKQLTFQRKSSILRQSKPQIFKWKTWGPPLLRLCWTTIKMRSA